MIERAVTDVCALHATGLQFRVDRAVVTGQTLDVWATLHFMPRTTPYCCGEPGCHLGHVFPERQLAIDDRVGQLYGQRVHVDFADRVEVRYHEDVRFEAH